MNRAIVDRLRDIIQSAELAFLHAGDLDTSALADAREHRDAALFRIAIIGEAASHLPPEVQALAPEIAWNDVKNMRNHLIHAYWQDCRRYHQERPSASDRRGYSPHFLCRTRQQMTLLVKICGLTTPDALDAALEAGADMVGFVFFAPSPRNLGFAEARLLGDRVRGRAQKVALSVDADDALLAASIAALKPDLLQLHGRESAELVGAIKARFGLPVMKAIAVESAADLAPVPIYAAVADRLIFDARAPREATRPGGLGKAFDWRLLANLDPKIPFMLSGGLDAGNVAEALRVTRAQGVDVSSGVERAPGEKDPDKIRAFVRAARAATSSPGPPLGGETEKMCPDTCSDRVSSA